MKPVRFKGCNSILSSNDPGVEPLEVMKLADQGGMVICCFELSKDELDEVNRTGKIYLAQMTFNRGFNPIRPAADLSDILEMK